MSFCRLEVFLNVDIVKICLSWLIEPSYQVMDILENEVLIELGGMNCMKEILAPSFLVAAILISSDKDIFGLVTMILFCHWMDPSSVSSFLPSFLTVHS